MALGSGHVRSPSALSPAPAQPTDHQPGELVTACGAAIVWSGDRIDVLGTDEIGLTDQLSWAQLIST